MTYANAATHCSANFYDTALLDDCCTSPAHPLTQSLLLRGLLFGLGFVDDGLVLFRRDVGLCRMTMLLLVIVMLLPDLHKNHHVINEFDDVKMQRAGIHTAAVAHVVCLERMQR